MTRRTVFFAALSEALFAGDEFYNAKAPSVWSAEEIARLTTSSPWAVQTHVRMAGSADNALSPGRSPIGKSSQDLPEDVFPSLKMGANANPALGSDNAWRGADGHTSPIAYYGRVIVTWESAEPIRMARKEPLPAQFLNHFAILVTGLPREVLKIAADGTESVRRQLHETRLEVTIKKRELAKYALVTPDQKSLLFAFPLRTFPPTRPDRFVSFIMNLNQMIVEVRFDLRQMMFRNRMAL